MDAARKPTTSGRASVAKQGVPRRDLIGLNTLKLGDAYKRNMRVYGIHFLTHGGDVFAVEWVRAESDEAAKRHAERLRTRFGKGHEIWDGDRLVHKVDY